LSFSIRTSGCPNWGCVQDPPLRQSSSLTHQRATLAIPEVVRLEVEHNLRSDLAEYIEEIRTKHRKLLTIFGAERSGVTNE
jgi:hypothetical protein